MLMDLYIPVEDAEGRGPSPEKVTEALQKIPMGAAVLVGRGTLPTVDDPVVQAVTAAGLSAHRAALIEAKNALLWVLPPDGEDLSSSIGQDDEEISHTAERLDAAGCAVLLCNPYARKLPGGSFRDYAVYLSGIHGVLAMMAAAEFQENLMAQEFGMMRGLACGGGSAVLGDHPDFGRFLTLGLFEGTDLQSIIDGIRAGQIRTIETSSEGLVDMFPRFTSRPDRKNDRDRDGRRGRDGGRGQNGGRGRDRGRGRSSGQGRDRRPRD